MFCVCLILHILSSKYFAESFGAFFTFKFPSNTGTFFGPFDYLRFPQYNFSYKFSIIGLNSGLKFFFKVPFKELFNFSVKYLTSVELFN